MTQWRQQTDGSGYAMTLWLHGWAIGQLNYSHILSYCSAKSSHTRDEGACESRQRIHAKPFNAAGIANGHVEGNSRDWNTAKFDGKWRQMDLAWNDISDNWYGSLDQGHLCFA